MAIFKVITAPDGSSIGHAKPQRLEDYLKHEEDEQGQKVPRDAHVSALNADAEHFSESCFDVALRFDTCNTYDSLKYKHYVQGFPPEDCGKMTKEECHRLGLEAAKTFWKDFPVLVVTHFDQEVEGTGEYHWHNHFVVYNCNVKTGRKINTTGAELWAQKRFVAAQAEEHNLTRKGLILENGRIRESKQEVKVNMAERQIHKRGRARIGVSGGELFLTQKAELRLAILSAQMNTSSYTEFCDYLKDTYGIQTKESRGSLGFLHPERRGQGRAWIRGKALGEAFTKEAILHGIEQLNGAGRVQAGTEAERIEYYKRLYRAIFSDHSPEEISPGDTDRGRGDLAVPGDTAPAGAADRAEQPGAGSGSAEREDRGRTLPDVPRTSGAGGAKL